MAKLKKDIKMKTAPAVKKLEKPMSEPLPFMPEHMQPIEAIVEDVIEQEIMEPAPDEEYHGGPRCHCGKEMQRIFDYAYDGLPWWVCPCGRDKYPA
jgi:hypothetical protein